MIKRTTIEIDKQLLTRATIEEALRRAAKQAEEERAARLREHLETLGNRVDLDVLASDEMWR